MLITQALSSGRGYDSVLVSQRQWTLLLRTVGLASAVTLFSSFIGAGAAFLLQRLSAAARYVVAFVLTMPLVVPQHIMAIAWVDVLGRNGYLAQFVHIALPGTAPAPSPFNLFGAIFILSLTAFPIPMIATLAGLHRFDQRLAEAARVGGQHGGIFLRIALPLLLPAIATGALIVFALTASSFAVPSLLQVTTYAVEIHASSSMFDYASATAQSLPLLALSAMVFIAWSVYVKPRHAWLSGSQRSIAIQPSPTVFTIALLFLLATITCIVPVAALFVRSLPLRTYASVWATAHDEIFNGIVVSVVAASVFTPMTFALVCLSRQPVLRRILNTVALAAFILPGSLVALGMIGVWNRSGLFGAVYDSLLVLVLACGTRFFALGDTLFPAAFAGHSARMQEAAAVAGLTWWRSLTMIVLPLTLPLIIVVWVLFFVFSLGEVDAAVLLCPPGQSTFAVRLFSLMHYGPDSFVAALCILTIASVGTVAACGATAAYVISRRVHRRA
ncbi:MAG: hypothetical protein SGI88_17445 [Candidatus Hydrogenedentes bacterium]|nr:hypothetical protein [Candidatus Hydrogenedentota bacterium]